MFENIIYNALYMVRSTELLIELSLNHLTPEPPRGEIFQTYIIDFQ